MCLLIFSYRNHPDYELVLAANRDEFYDRPTAPAAFWREAPMLLAGRDLRDGGTWLGITKTGRLAAVTNFRDPKARKEKARSRGLLVSGYLLGDLEPREYLERLACEAHGYQGFNLLVGDRMGLYFFSNRENIVRSLGPGLYGLSNHLLNTPWPKVQKTKKALSRLLEHGNAVSAEAIFELLADRTRAEDEALPDTGVGLEMERILSPPFIVSPGYGTRSSTALIIDHRGRVSFAERSFGADGTQLHTTCFEFALEEG